MKVKNSNTSNLQDKLAELSLQEIEQVAGGRQIYLDGMLVEMSGNGISALINSGAVRQITVKGVAYPGSQHEVW